MRRHLTVFLLGVLFAYHATAHACLVKPAQRGPTPNFGPADSNCFQRMGSCGGFPAQAPVEVYKTGVFQRIDFQQNMNHWTINKPGFMDVAVSYDSEATWDVLASVDDFPTNNIDAQTYLSTHVRFRQASNAAVLRLRYVSYNPFEVSANNTDGVFYACADIKILQNEGMANHEEDVVVAKAAAASDPQCITPPRWTATGRTNSNPPILHQIWYDNVAGFERWDRTDAAGMNISLLWNMTLSPTGTTEYGINLPGPGKCAVIGADAFYQWQYGSQNGMTFYRNVTNPAGEVFTIWQNTNNGLMWEATAECLPVADIQGTKITVWESKAVASIDPSVFAIPASCMSADAVMMGCNMKRV